MGNAVDWNILGIKWILFDAYGTLFDAGKENIPMLSEQMSKLYGLPKEVILQRWSSGYFSLENRFKTNFLTIIQANRISLSYAFGELGIPIFDVENWIQKLIWLWSVPSLYPGVESVFQSIAHFMPDVNVGIISNTDEVTIRAAVQNSGLPIKFVMSSERAGCYKPNPDIFKKSLEELKISNQECIYIGNSVGDIEGAFSASIRSIYVDREGNSLPGIFNDTIVLENISQLSYFLESICLNAQN